MPIPVVSPRHMREFEKYIFDVQHIPSALLMENAGRSVAQAVNEHISPKSCVLIVCGRGNNGGDGFVCARQLALMGHAPIVWCSVEKEKLSGDALIMYEAMIGSGIECNHIGKVPNHTEPISAVVDALFGIGLNRNIDGIEAELISFINQLHGAVFSVDIPSGIDAGTGQMLGCAVKAGHTITFQSPKPGHLLFPGKKFAGSLHVVPIGIDTNRMLPNLHTELMVYSDLESMLPPREEDAHKGDFGKALLIGGSSGFAGAVIMAARAAVKTGTGLLTVAAPSDVAKEMWSALPEAMAHELSSEKGVIASDCVEQVQTLTQGKNCAAIGPGLGSSPIVMKLIKNLITHTIPVVIDADGLNALCGSLDVLKDCASAVILTPHVGEMARLLSLPIDIIAANLVKAAQTLAHLTGAVVLLKSATSVIASPDGKYTFNISGGPQLAKGGSGDVLTGIILALLSQGLTPYDAARYGALLLGTAAQRVDMPAPCVCASDVIAAIPAAMRG